MLNEIDIIISFKDFELVWSKLIEMNWLQIYKGDVVNWYDGWMRGTPLV